MESPQAREALQRDEQLKDHLGIWALPAFVVERQGKAIVLRGMPTAAQMEEAVLRAGDGLVKPVDVRADGEALLGLLRERHLLSLVEVAAAFGLADEAAARALAQPLLDEGATRMLQAPKGSFLELA